MDGLPDELLIEIFTYFDLKTVANDISKVCTRWLRLSKTPSLYTHFSLESERDLSLLTGLEVKNRIRSIEVCYAVDLINPFIQTLADVCPCVTSISIANCNLLSDRHVVKLFECFPQLCHVNVFLLSYFVSPTFLNAIGRVKSLVLNNHMDENTLKTVAYSCENLTELHMYGGIQYYPLCHLHAILILKFESLKKLSLRCAEVNNRTCELLAKCTRLKHLFLYHCWLITDAGLAQLSTMERMESLHVTGLKLTTERGFDVFMKRLDTQCMIDLNLSSTPFCDRTVEFFTSKRQNIKRLELWQCRKLTPQGILRLMCILNSLLTLDTDIELSHEIMNHIIRHPSIKYVRMNSGHIRAPSSPNDGNVPKKLLTFSDSYGHYSEYIFRGNAEGYSANLMCYTSNADNLDLKIKHKYTVQIEV